MRPLEETPAPWPQEAEEAYARLEPAILPILDFHFSDDARTVLLHECPCGIHSIVVVADQAVNDALAAAQQDEDPQGTVGAALDALGHKLHYHIEQARRESKRLDWARLATAVSQEARRQHLDLNLSCFAEVHMMESDVMIWLALPSNITAPFRHVARI